MRVVQQIAKKYKLDIWVRPVSKAVIRLRERGHPAKPAQMKMKTFKELDVHLGAGPSDIGKVGFFEPQLPDNIWGQKQWKAINNRYNARNREWKTMQSTVQELADKGIAELRGKVLVDPNTGKGYTGDPDLFSIESSGRELVYEDLVKEIGDALDQEPVGVQHGALATWELELGDAESFANLVRSHRPGGEALIKFGPDGKVSRGHFDD